ncbi:MAG: hypothetical protein FWD90_05645 [Defluviitaleaceae bacterium]|nr:hypothetical protein [Defluviitaleaceae bacterium]
MRYCPIAVVEGGENHESLWSSSVINTNINGRKTEAELSFLADDAPHNLLITGKKVLLYEGQSVVAEGKIL